jgi:hypothetical protein
MRVDAICAYCGRRLKGTYSWTPGKIHVGRHKRPDGKPCLGHLVKSHKAVA